MITAKVAFDPSRIIPVRPDTKDPLASDVYPSRSAGGATIVDRVDPTVYPGGPKTERLSAEDLASFETNGYLLVKNLFNSAEVRKFSQELVRLTSDSRIRACEATITEPGTDMVRSVFGIHQLSRFFEWLARDDRLLSVARRILGGDVYLHQTRASLKPGFHGKEFYWHSDFETWHSEDGMPRMRALSLAITLSDSCQFNGPLLIPGSHKTFVKRLDRAEARSKSSLRLQSAAAPDEDSLKRLVDRGGIVAPPLSAGSALFFDCNLMHAGSPNLSPGPLITLFFVYNSVDNALAEPYGGLAPRPEYLAARGRAIPLAPIHVEERHQGVSGSSSSQAILIDELAQRIEIAALNSPTDDGVEIGEDEVITVLKEQLSESNTIVRQMIDEVDRTLNRIDCL